MAHMMIATKNSRRELIGIDAAVGRGGSNNRPDVLAVQYLLRVAMESGKVFQSDPFKPPGEDPIEIDGIYGRQTQAYIDFFQAEVNRRFSKKLVEPDGRVDPVRNGAPRSSITNTFYTIMALNSAMSSRRGDTFQLEKDALMPGDLKSSLFIDF